MLWDMSNDLKDIEETKATGVVEPEEQITFLDNFAMPYIKAVEEQVKFLGSLGLVTTENCGVTSGTLDIAGEKTYLYQSPEYLKYERTSGIALPGHKGTRMSLSHSSGENPSLAVEFEVTSPSDQKSFSMTVKPYHSEVFVSGNVKLGASFVMAWVNYSPNFNPFTEPITNKCVWDISSLKLFPYIGLLNVFGRLLHVEPTKPTPMFGKYPKSRASEIFYNPCFKQSDLNLLIIKMIRGELDLDLGNFLPRLLDENDRKPLDLASEPIADMEFFDD